MDSDDHLEKSPTPLSSDDVSRSGTPGTGTEGDLDGCRPVVRKKKRRFFSTEWSEAHPWVRYDEEARTMYCLQCTNTKQRSAMIYLGTNRLKLCVLTEHEKTKAHKQAVLATKQRNRTAEALLSELERNDKGLVNMFRAMYYLAREDLAIMKFDSLCTLVRSGGGAMLNSYRNHHSGSEMLHCLAVTACADLVTSVQRSPFLSILIDESTDVSVHKQLIMYLRYLESSGPVTQFGSILHLENGTAVTIYTTIRRQLTDWGVDITRVVGFGSDGAKVMTGKLNGVGAKLREEVPHLVSIHCVAHRLALASATVTEESPEIVRYEKVIQDVYNYLAHSTNRRAELELWQSVCDEPAVTMKSFSATRWLSIHNSVQAVARSYTSLLAFLGMEAIESSAARGIFSEIKQWRFAALTFIMNDILGSLTSLSKKFQKDDLPLPRLLGLVESSKRELTACYLGEDGPIWGAGYREWLSKYGAAEKMGETELHRDDGDEAFLKEIVSTFVKNVFEGLKERFPSSAFVTAVQVLDPCRIPQDDTVKVQYGEESIKVLCNQFSSIVNVESVLAEWNQLKFEDFSSTTFRSPWQFYQDYSLSYPELWKLVQALLVLPVNTAACERGFSKIKIIKTDRRNRLSSEQLNNLMTISLASVDNEDNLISHAIKLWHRKKRRHFSPVLTTTRGSQSSTS